MHRRRGGDGPGRRTGALTEPRRSSRARGEEKALAAAASYPHRRLRKRQLLTRPPFMGDIVQNHRAPHALDRPLLEAVPSVVARHENHRAAALEGRAAEMALLAR